MSDYLNSVIYMIKKKDDYDNKNVYIGSTKDFMKRKNCHKNGCNNPNSRGYNMKLYQYIRDNGGWDEWCMVVIQDYPCDSRDELKECEDIIMCEIKSVLNNNRANRSIKEWCIDNRDKLAEKKKEYYQNNSDKIKEQHKEYHKLNKEKINEKKKEYRKLNKDKVKERDKEYRELNKQKIEEKRSEKIKCDKCGSEVRRDGLSAHKKTLKCKDFVH